MRQPRPCQSHPFAAATAASPSPRPLPWDRASPKLHVCGRRTCPRLAGVVHASAAASLPWRMVTGPCRGLAKGAFVPPGRATRLGQLAIPPRVTRRTRETVEALAMRSYTGASRVACTSGPLTSLPDKEQIKSGTRDIPVASKNHQRICRSTCSQACLSCWGVGSPILPARPSDRTRPLPASSHIVYIAN